jgi:hypothetical protein
MVSDSREQIEAEISSIKHEIEKLKSLAKKRMGQPRDLEMSLINFASYMSEFPSLIGICGRASDICNSPCARTLDD